MEQGVVAWTSAAEIFSNGTGSGLLWFIFFWFAETTLLALFLVQSVDVYFPSILSVSATCQELNTFSNKFLPGYHVLFALSSSNVISQAPNDCFESPV